MEISSNILVFVCVRVCWFIWRELSVKFSKCSWCKFGLLRTRVNVWNIPPPECPQQRHSGCHVKSPPCSSALPIFLHTPMCWGLHCFGLPESPVLVSTHFNWVHGTSESKTSLICYLEAWWSLVLPEMGTRVCLGTQEYILADQGLSLGTNACRSFAIGSPDCQNIFYHQPQFFDLCLRVVTESLLLCGIDPPYQQRASWRSPYCCAGLIPLGI